jgi:Domain of unknown function (DUF4328)
MKPAPPFTDLSRLTKALRVVLLLLIALSLEAIVESLRALWIVHHPDSPSFTPGEELWQSITSGVSSLLSTVAAVLLLVWVFKSYRNAIALSSDLPTSPGWAIAYFFIPYLSLYKPYRIVCDLWKASGDPRGWQEQKGTALILAWWSFRIISILMGAITLGMRPGENEQALAPYDLFYGTDILMELINIVYLLLEVLLVGRLWARLKAHAPESSRIISQAG